MSENERKRMAKNLYSLLWVPIEGGRNVDMYMGRYLQSEDVRIKVMRTVAQSSYAEGQPSSNCQHRRLDQRENTITI